MKLRQWLLQQLLRGQHLMDVIISEVMNMDAPLYDSVIEVVVHHTDDLARIDSLREDLERL